MAFAPKQSRMIDSRYSLLLWALALTGIGVLFLGIRPTEPTRPVATPKTAATLPVQVGAGLVHAPNGWLFSNANGGWEFSAVLVLLSVAVWLLGDGAYSVRRASLEGQPQLARA